MKNPSEKESNTDHLTVEKLWDMGKTLLKQPFTVHYQPPKYAYCEHGINTMQHPYMCGMIAEFPGYNKASLEMAYVSKAMLKDPIAMQHAAKADVKALEIRIKAYGKACQVYLLAKLHGHSAAINVGANEVSQARQQVIAAMINVEKTVLSFYGVEFSKE